VAGVDGVAWLAELLRGRTKRDLIRSMLVRTPGAEATEMAVSAIEVYPLIYLLLACEHPTRIWLLDVGERLSTAGILTPEMRNRRWHSSGIGIDECEGLVDVAPEYLAMVSSCRTELVLRHEFAHVVTTFFNSEERSTLSQLYSRASKANRFTEALARESLGEFVACALSYSFFGGLARRLATLDPALYEFVAHLRSRAESVSQALAASQVAVPIGAGSIY